MILLSLGHCTSLSLPLMQGQRHGPFCNATNSDLWMSVGRGGLLRPAHGCALQHASSSAVNGRAGGLASDSCCFGVLIRRKRASMVPLCFSSLCMAHLELVRCHDHPLGRWLSVPRRSRAICQCARSCKVCCMHVVRGSRPHALQDFDEERCMLCRGSHRVL